MQQNTSVTTKEPRHLPPRTGILLVQPPQGDFVRRRIFNPGVEIPLHLGYMAAVLERNAIPSMILDLRLHERPFDKLGWTVRQFRPGVVGLSAYTSEIGNAGRAAALVKEIDPEVLVVLGGHHASAVPEDTLARYGEIDCLVRGEGELTLVELMGRWKEGRGFDDVAGLVTRTDTGARLHAQRPLIADLDDLPMPARHRMELARYAPHPATGNAFRLPTTGIMASRGCPFHCRYCSKGVWGNTLRVRSVEGILQEIERCRTDFGITDLRFFDDGLTMPKMPLDKLCGAMIRYDRGLTWNCYSCVGDVTEARLRLMKRAGCYHVKYGIEFGTDKALRLTGKGSTLAQARAAVAMTKQVGIECKASFILGIPGETMADCEQTLRFAIELSPDLAAFYPFDLFPGSRFHQILHGKGKADNTELIPRGELENLASRAYMEFYLRPAFMLQRGERLARHPLRDGRILAAGGRLVGRALVKGVVAKATTRLQMVGSRNA